MSTVSTPTPAQPEPFFNEVEEDFLHTQLMTLWGDYFETPFSQELCTKTFFEELGKLSIQLAASY